MRSGLPFVAMLLARTPLQTNLMIARDRRFMSPAEVERLWTLSEETVATTTRLLESLRRRGGTRGRT